MAILIISLIVFILVSIFLYIRCFVLSRELSEVCESRLSMIERYEPLIQKEILNHGDRKPDQPEVETPKRPEVETGDDDILKEYEELVRLAALSEIPVETEVPEPEKPDTKQSQESISSASQNKKTVKTRRKRGNK